MLPILPPPLGILLHSRLNLDLHLALIHQRLDLLFHPRIVLLGFMPRPQPFLGEPQILRDVLLDGTGQLLRVGDVGARDEVLGKGTVVGFRSAGPALEVASGMCQADARDGGCEDAAGVVEGERELLEGYGGQGAWVDVARADGKAWLRLFWRVVCEDGDAVAIAGRVVEDLVEAVFKVLRVGDVLGVPCCVMDCLAGMGARTDGLRHVNWLRSDDGG